MQYICSIFLLVALTVSSYAQIDTLPKAQKSKVPVRVGYRFQADLNLYSWHQKPTSIYKEKSSSGQVLNVLPGLGLGFWIGDVKHWLFSVEGSVRYLPFEFDMNQYKGLGSLAFPVQANLHFPIAKQNSTWVLLHLGGGLQWLKTDLYARPDAIQKFANPYYYTIYGEIGVHLAAVSKHLDHLREVEIFFQAGAGNDNSLFFSSGMKLSFWNQFGRP